LDIEVAVKFDRIEVIFWFDEGEINKQLLLINLKPKFLKGFYQY